MAKTCGPPRAARMHWPVWMSRRLSATCCSRGRSTIFPRRTRWSMPSAWIDPPAPRCVPFMSMASPMYCGVCRLQKGLSMSAVAAFTDRPTALGWMKLHQRSQWRRPGKSCAPRRSCSMRRSRMPSILRFAGIYGPGRLLRQKAVQAGERNPRRRRQVAQLNPCGRRRRAVLAAEAIRPTWQNLQHLRRPPGPAPRLLHNAGPASRRPAPRFESPPPDTAPPHEKANRRLGNQRMRDELQVNPQYEDYEAGIRASCGNRLPSN